MDKLKIKNISRNEILEVEGGEAIELINNGGYILIEDAGKLTEVNNELVE